MDKLDILLERISQNYNDYVSRIMETDKNTMFDSAWEIAAVSDAHFYLTESHEFSDEEIDYFLKYDSPLMLVADEWQRRQSDISDITFALDEVLNDQDKDKA
ncbi:hypothetical protein AGMMS49992_23920 [Clostridia bacterium]|nr:hypothetical protein AGMMS49992_23920 [Clostridia bacterium]